MSELRVRRVAGTLAAIAMASMVISGCATVGYYAKSVGGHLELMSMRTPVDRLIADERTDAELRARLIEAVAMRDFAHRHLDLPDNDSYRSYVDLDRDYVSWTVVAAGEFSLEPKTWCFPVVGCVAYRGYFEEADARRFAAGLARRGYDVHVAGVKAYSTLGWFDDPLLDTMLRLPEHRLAGVIFHELAHQRLYVPGDSGFNEAYAVVIEREGVKRWIDQKGDESLKARYRIDQDRHARVLELVEKARQALKELYESGLDEHRMREQKAAIFERMRAGYRRLRESWNGYSGYDAWFESGLNNAKLALIATYNEYVPALEALLESTGGNLRDFNTACETLARLSPDERSAALERWASP